MGETIVSTSEAARYLGVSVETLQKWRSSRSRQPLPFVRISPRKIGYATSALAEFVRARRFVCTKDYTPAA